MDNQKNNFFKTNSDSDLDLLFREALQNHSVPAEDHVWRRIKHGLADKKEETPITKSITKRSYLPIWSAISGIAASLLIWAVFFGNSTSNNIEINSNTIANSSQTEIAKELSSKNLNNSENVVSLDSDKNSLLESSENNSENNSNTDATTSKQIASKKQQIPPTITIKNTSVAHQAKNNTLDIRTAVASLEKDQTKNKHRNSQDKTSVNPSTHISDNVWASDFVVQNSNYSTKLNSKEKAQNTTTHQLNLDNQTVAITIKVGKNENLDITTSQATGFDANQNPSQFDKAKSVLKEVWNLKTGKKVNLQNILPNNENEKATENTTNSSNSNNEIQAD